MDKLILLASVLGGLAVLAVLVFQALGIVVIGENEVGIVNKKFASKNLPAGRVVATDGEAGLQAETLSPGWHFFLWKWQFAVKKVGLTVIEPGSLGLVMAIDGQMIDSQRILARGVDCENYQNALSFLKNGGQKGKQLTVLTAGKYRINTDLFNITKAEVTSIPSNTVGIVTTLDGAALQGSEIAGPAVANHENFQKIQAFIDNGGKRGLQEQVILAGQWNLNPWFAKVKTVPMTEIPIGYVGVFTSFVGKAHLDVSGDSFKHGDLVDEGHKGVWEKPLYPGKHPVNTDTAKVDLIPTTNVVLNWATNRSESHNLDKNLSSITVRSKDGFSYNLDVSVVIHIGAKDASRVISRMGSMSGLISQVLEPTIGNYFRNAAQENAALDFLKSRTEMQQKASGYVHDALKQYDVEAVDTLIGDIVLPANLLATQTERKLAEEMQKTYEVQGTSQKQKEALNRQTAITEMQQSVVASEQGVRIAQLKAEGMVKEAEGQTKVAEQSALQKIRLAEADAKQIQTKAEAEAAGVRAKGLAQADAYQAGVKAMGENNFALLETMGVIGKEHVKIIPDMVINGGGSDGGSGSGIMNVLMASLLKDRMDATKASKPAAPTAETKKV